MRNYLYTDLIYHVLSFLSTENLQFLFFVSKEWNLFTKKYIEKKKIDRITDINEYLIKKGYLDLLKWSKNKNLLRPLNKFSCIYAVENAHLYVLQWLYNQNPPCSWDE